MPLEEAGVGAGTTVTTLVPGTTNHVEIRDTTRAQGKSKREATIALLPLLTCPREYFTEKFTTSQRRCSYESPYFISAAGVGQVD